MVGSLLAEIVPTWATVDPTKVVCTALQNAASVAGLLLTTAAMVAEKPEEKKAAPPMPPGDMMSALQTPAQCEQE